MVVVLRRHASQFLIDELLRVIADSLPFPREDRPYGAAIALSLYEATCGGVSSFITVSVVALSKRARWTDTLGNSCATTCCACGLLESASPLMCREV